MAYGSFNKSIVNNYNRVTYTLGSSSYKDISIFKTNPQTMSVAPSCHIKGDKQKMENMNPNGIAASKVIAKCTATPMTYGQNGDAFYGLFYTYDKKYWFNNKQISISAYDNTQNNCYPDLCVKTDGSAIIRFFTSPSSVTVAAPYCSSIIAGAHPLVYASKSVFESVVYSTNDGKKRIADWNDIDSTQYHFNNAICSRTATGKYNRVFFGHRPDGSYFLVCVDRDTMDLRVGAKLMCDLGCDYAVNEDGATATQMRVASGYSGSYAAGKMTVGGTDYYGAAICVYLK